MIEHLHSGISRSFFAEFRESFMSDDHKCGCPIGNISQEMAATNPRFREKLSAVFSDIMKPVSLCLDRAVELGDLSPSIDTVEIAEFIINSCRESPGRPSSTAKARCINLR